MALTSGLLELYLVGKTIDYDDSIGTGVFNIVDLPTMQFKYVKIAGTKDGNAFTLAETKTLTQDDWVVVSGDRKLSPDLLYTINLTNEGATNITINKILLYTESGGSISDLVAEVDVTPASFSQSGSYTITDLIIDLV